MSSSKQLDSQAMVDAATQADRLASSDLIVPAAADLTSSNRNPATTEQVMPIFNAAYSDVAALKEMLQSLHARLKARPNIQGGSCPQLTVFLFCYRITFKMKLSS